MIPPRLLERLPLVGDGSPAHLLRVRHPGAAGPVEALNQRRPEWPRGVHEDYRRAGARALRTNTAQANALALAGAGLEENCEAINNSGCSLARAAAGKEALVMGAIGEIRGGPETGREHAYGQQAVYLCDTGADFILLEAFATVAEAVRARRAVRDAGDAPVLALLRAGGPGAAAGMSVGGLQPLEAARRLADGGVDAVGILVGADIADLRPWLEALAPGGLPLAAFVEAAPGAELPPAAYAQRLSPLASTGAILLGGGAGIGPEHVAALVKRLGHDSEP
jgi:homocysteine S-methyltransferase